MEYALPNCHLILDGFDRLLGPLVDYETETLKAHYGKSWWKTGVLNVLRGSYREAVEGKTSDDERKGSLDIGCALILMFADWDRVFKNYSVDVLPGLIRKAPIIADKLFALRNSVSHHKTVDFNPFETKTGLQQMAVLCRCFDPATASTIENIIKEIGRKAESDSCPSGHKPEEVANRAPPTIGDKPFCAQDGQNGRKESKNNEIRTGAVFLEDRDRRVPDISGIVSACLKSADDQIIFNSLQSLGSKEHESVVHIESWQMSGKSDVICRITEALVDNSEYTLVINRRCFSGDDVDFTLYDRDEHTLVISVSENVLDFMRSQDIAEMKLVGDLSFLVHNLRDFLDRFGSYITYPRPESIFPSGSYDYPRSRVPTASQKDAIYTVLNSGLSYVWGAPGTGKTQMALATALIACIKAGQKVAVVAPTNLAVEQVLRGLISIINENEDFRSVVDPSRDILRLGMASEEFLREYPQVCETKIMQSVIDRKQNLMMRLMDVPFERELGRIMDQLKGQQLRIAEYVSCKDPSRIEALRSEIGGASAELYAFFEFHNKLFDLGQNVDFSRSVSVDQAVRFVNDYTQLSSDLVDYFEWTDDALRNTVRRLSQEVRNLTDMKDKIDNLNAKIIALTPHCYISRFIPKGYDDTKYFGRRFDVDHIFLDEAGYCSAILALPLLANGVPLTLLGDHKQLPPVCATDLETIEKMKLKNPKAFSDPAFMKYWFLWDMSSIYLDTFFIRNVDEIQEIHDLMIPPICRDMKVCILKESYRFGKNLGDILDRLVYRNGISGITGDNLVIQVINAGSPTGKDILTKDDPENPGMKRVKRANILEVEAIRNYLDENPMDRRQFAILSPYRDQVVELNKAIPECAYRNTLTVHRSQGREWDNVILSVVDGLHTSGLDHPRRFTSIKEDGLNLINTAVSRAKKRLLIVCDADYWGGFKDELITQLVREGELIN